MAPKVSKSTHSTSIDLTDESVDASMMPREQHSEGAPDIATALGAPSTSTTSSSTAPSSHINPQPENDTPSRRSPDAQPSPAESDVEGVAVPQMNSNTPSTLYEADSDSTTDSGLLHDMHPPSESQSYQDKSATEISPLTNPSYDTRHQHDMSTPGTATPPKAHNVASETEQHCLPTPAESLSTKTSTPAPSPVTFQNFPERVKSTKETHFKRGHIFSKTRQEMRFQSDDMLVLASRGFQRAGHVPTKQTQPPLRKRRYSVDIMTVETDCRHGPKRAKYHEEPLAQPVFFDENEPSIQTESVLEFPDPRRYPSLGLRSATYPPVNQDIYLELGAATITNEAWHFMTITERSVYDNEVWMRGESLDMALEVLRRDKNCEAYGIDIANSNMSQIFYIAGMCQDGQSNAYDEYRRRFKHKRWIFLPINDGFGGTTNDGHSGTHWSLVVMDTIEHTVHYFDSLYVQWEWNQRLAKDVSIGLMSILGEDISEWVFESEINSPHQWKHNQFTGDGGPCGPFVYKMTEILVENIIFQEHRQERRYGLSLPDWFPEHFVNLFHSGQVRWQMQQSLVRYKAEYEATWLIQAHDLKAVQNEGATLSTKLPETFYISPQPKPSVQRHEHKRRRCSNYRHKSSTGRNGSKRYEVIDLDTESVPHDAIDNPQVSRSSDPAEVIWLDPPDPSTKASASTKANQRQRRAKYDSRGREHHPNEASIDINGRSARQTTYNTSEDDSEGSPISRNT